MAYVRGRVNGVGPFSKLMSRIIFVLAENGTSYSVNNCKQLKVHKMHTAVRLNELILEHSLNSQLVLLNLPKPPVGKEGLDDYIHYLEVTILSFFQGYNG